MTPVLPLGPRVLEGRHIRLEPLSDAHHAGLIAAAADPQTWTYIPIVHFKDRLGWMVEENAQGRMLTFVVVRKLDGAVVGSTSYLAIAPNDARVEVGFTWYIAEARGGATNPEAKYLLLENAFAAHYNRVEFKTDARNARSRAALLKLGAREEGTLRGHMWMPQGYFRDSVYFSVLAGEWPAVRTALEKRLAEMA
ncbi:MAG: GNAT family N-acetyltransferase [Alphaproteobacteria bacterium]|nr:GNAT family N-acetyltransferase [Alphaproteobacteria bacterium]